MNKESSSGKKIHHGHNLKRLREILGVKQEILADRLNMNQQAISRLEAKAEIEQDLLEKIANALKVPCETIKSFNDEHTINIISSTFNDKFDGNSSFIANNPSYNFNPVDKIVDLYERMLKLEQDKIVILEKVLKEKSSKTN